MDDLHALAELSHGVERAALALASEGHDVKLIAHELEPLSAGQREAVALALAYLLRRRERSTDPATDPALADAIDAVVLALRRMS